MSRHLLLSQLVHTPIFPAVKRFAVTQQVVSPDEKPVEDRPFAYDHTRDVVQQPRRLVERAGLNAIGAVHIVLDPEPVTPLRISVPFQHAGMIGDGLAFIRGPIGRHAFGRAMFHAFFAMPAKLSRSERSVGVHGQRHVGKDFAKTDPGAECLRNQ